MSNTCARFPIIPSNATTNMLPPPPPPSNGRLLITERPNTVGAHSANLKKAYENEDMSTEIESNQCKSLSPLSDVGDDDIVIPHLLDMDLEFQPPSPSIIEVPVPPKPPPEIISLEEDDDALEEIGYIRHDDSAIPKNVFEEALVAYDAQFPGHLWLPADDIKMRSKNLLLETSISPERDGGIAMEIMVINFCKHMEKNQAMLSTVIKSRSTDKGNLEAAWSSWSVRNELSIYLEKCIGLRCSPRATITDPVIGNWKQLSTSFSSGNAQIQLVLLPRYSETTRWIQLTNSLRVNQWSPLNLTMSFQLFSGTITRTLVPCNLPLQLIRVLKKWYIEYMHNVSESNQEFLLAAISTFGTSLRSYPGRILDLFQMRNMINPDYRFSSTIEPNPVHIGNDDNKIPKQNKRLANEIEAWKNYKKTEAIRQSTPSASTVVPLPVVHPPVPLPVAHPPVHPPVVHPPVATEETFNPMREYKFSLEQFAVIARQIWRDFYGSHRAISQSSINEWYEKFEYTTSLRPKLFQALRKLQAEHARKQPAIVKTITTAELTRLRIILEPELKLRREKYGLSKSQHESTVQTIVTTGTSLFQLCLIQNLGEHASLPTNWCPLTWFLPYQVFKALFEWQVKSGAALVKLDENAVIVRYVELMADFFGQSASANQSVDKILLAIFSAIGPHFGPIPLRVLYILQQTKLLRRDLELPECTPPHSSCAVFGPLDQNYRRFLTEPTTLPLQQTSPTVTSNNQPRPIANLPRPASNVTVTTSYHPRCISTVAQPTRYSTATASFQPRPVASVSQPASNVNVTTSFLPRFISSVAQSTSNFTANSSCQPRPVVSSPRPASNATNTSCFQPRPVGSVSQPASNVTATTSFQPQHISSVAQPTSNLTANTSFQPRPVASLAQPASNATYTTTFQPRPLTSASQTARNVTVIATSFQSQIPASVPQTTSNISPIHVTVRPTQRAGTGTPTPVSTVTRTVTEAVDKFLEWKKSAGDALGTFALPALSDNGYKETFTRHTTQSGSIESTNHLEFRKGMLAGISLAIKSYEERRLDSQLTNTALPTARAEIFPGSSYFPFQDGKAPLRPEHLIPQLHYNQHRAGQPYAYSSSIPIRHRAQRSFTQPYRPYNYPRQPPHAFPYPQHRFPPPPRNR